jgi:hypothetical protein
MFPLFFHSCLSFEKIHGDDDVLWLKEFRRLTKISQGSDTATKTESNTNYQASKE